MKVQLIVVSGKSEGKKIPLAGPLFKIGRGETCHLRPSSEQVSREHAEFRLTADALTLRDLGSRNGTLLNGRALNGSQVLHDSDFVQVGPLVFEVRIADDARPPSAPTVRKPPAVVPDPTDPGATDSWLIRTPVGDSLSGDTMMIAAFKGPIAPSGSSDDCDEQYVRHPQSDRDVTETPPGVPPPAPAKASRSRTAAPSESPPKNDAASDILRRMMEQRRTSK